MASERSEFIKRHAARLQVASVAADRRIDRIVAMSAEQATVTATMLADALNLTDIPSPAPAGGETYAIDRVAADEWFGIFDGVPPIPENERRMYLAIAAARGKGAT